MFVVFVDRTKCLFVTAFLRWATFLTWTDHSQNWINRFGPIFFVTWLLSGNLLIQWFTRGSSSLQSAWKVHIAMVEFIRSYELYRTSSYDRMNYILRVHTCVWTPYVSASWHICMKSPFLDRGVQSWLWTPPIEFIRARELHTFLLAILGFGCWESVWIGHEGMAEFIRSYELRNIHSYELGMCQFLGLTFLSLHPSLTPYHNYPYLALL